MILTPEQVNELEEAAKPLMKYLADNFHPHVKVIVESNNAELVEGLATVQCDEFIKD